MDIFIKDFERGLHEHWESDKLSKEEIFDFTDGNTLLKQVKRKKLSKKQYQMVNKDLLYNEALNDDGTTILEAINEMLQDRIADVDLKSYDFYKDPDCSYSFGNK